MRAPGAAVELPDRVDRVVAVGVDDVRALVRVAGQVVLHDAVGGDRVDVLVRVEAVVERADVDVVHVEQQAAVGLLGQSRARNSHSGMVEAANST